MQDILNGIGHELLQTMLPVLATAIAGLLVGILTRYLKKVGLEVDAKQEARLKEITVQAINSVEERSRRDGAAGADKHGDAVDIITAKLPHVSGAEASQSIDAQLPEQRAKLTPAIALAPIAPVLIPSTPATFGRAPDA